MTINAGLLDRIGKPALVSTTDDVYVGSTATGKVLKVVGLGIAGNSVPVTGAAAALATDGTITPTGPIMRFAPAAASTGVIIAAGSQDGQRLTIVNESGANTITMAIVATSRVLNGVGCIVSVNACVELVWCLAANSTGAWIQVRAA